jgi:hypothetical protein
LNDHPSLNMPPRLPRDCGTRESVPGQAAHRAARHVRETGGRPGTPGWPSTSLNRDLRSCLADRSDLPRCRRTPRSCPEFSKGWKLSTPCRPRSSAPWRRPVPSAPVLGGSLRSFVYGSSPVVETFHHGLFFPPEMPANAPITLSRVFSQMLPFEHVCSLTTRKEKQTRSSKNESMH